MSRSVHDDFNHPHSPVKAPRLFAGGDLCISRNDC
jgi:hypothetical protein